MAKEQTIIMPGEVLTSEEEYAPGRNTRAVEGKVISTVMGKVEFDDTNKEVRVIGKTVQEIRGGDIIMGQVMLVKESSASIQLLAAENGKKITGIGVGQLAIRNVSNEYVTELKKKVKIGDLIRARIVDASELGIDLSTKEKGLGVIKAYCTNCRHEMQYAEGKLTCAECGSVEERKWFEAEDTYKPREGGFERRGSFGGGFRGGRREGGFGGHSGGFRGGRGGGRGFGGDRGRGGFGGRREGNSHSFGRKSFDGPRRQEF